MPFVSTNTTERSKGIFSDGHAKKLIDLFQDMIEGAPISKRAILKRLANEELHKTLFNVMFVHTFGNRDGRK